jgi:hypothetical protein
MVRLSLQEEAEKKQADDKKKEAEAKDIPREAPIPKVEHPSSSYKNDTAYRSLRNFCSKLAANLKKQIRGLQDEFNRRKQVADTVLDPEEELMVGHACISMDIWIILI